MKVVISGYYGFGNTGDEAVLAAIVKGIKARGPQTNICVLPRRAWGQIIGELFSADLLLSGGGSLFQDKTSRRSFFYYVGIIILAKLFRKKVMFFAQGFGPLRRKLNQRIAAYVLQLCDLITVRDHDSYLKIIELGVDKSRILETADPTLTLPVPVLEKGKNLFGLETLKANNQLLVGIAARSLNRVSSNRLFELLAKTADWIHENHGYYPFFFLFQSPEDREAASKILGYMHGNSTVNFRVAKPDEILAIISQCDLLIGMRLHSLIFAAINAVPMIGLSYDPKVESFMKSIDQPYIDVEKELDFETVKKKIEAVIANRREVKLALEKKKKELVEKAERNFDLLWKLLVSPA
ncbi:MAG: polysaccharide pyruvyl transferase CsaB [Candidatus Margulisbacteria bacterium]|nr:polysaccharide pyruvyl transferase CsaB [Candidatus Margulisiibacteriota bacterium]